MLILREFFTFGKTWHKTETDKEEMFICSKNKGKLFQVYPWDMGFEFPRATIFDCMTSHNCTILFHSRFYSKYL